LNVANYELATLNMPYKLIGKLHMKKLLLLAAMSSLFLTGCVIAIGGHDYQRSDLQEIKKQLILDDAQDVHRLTVKAGRGDLKIIGDKSISQITVDSVIGTENGNDYEFSLNRQGDVVVLVAKADVNKFDNSYVYLDLIVRVPSSINLDINDGSGHITISDMMSDVSIDDGSGNMHVTNITGAINMYDGSGHIELKNVDGAVNIKDGSGNIFVTQVGSTLDIVDGSGHVEAFHITGDISLDDGSGNIQLNDVTGNVKIDDGSGYIDVNHVSANVTISDGSGNISVTDSGSLTITEAGSGHVTINNILGDVSM